MRDRASEMAAKRADAVRLIDSVGELETDIAGAGITSRDVVNAATTLERSRASLWPDLLSEALFGASPVASARRAGRRRAWDAAGACLLAALPLLVALPRLAGCLYTRHSRRCRLLFGDDEPSLTRLENSAVRHRGALHRFAPRRLDICARGDRVPPLFAARHIGA